MATFGNTAEVISECTWGNRQIAYAGTVADGTGKADSISTYVKFTGASTGKFKAALYEYVDVDDAGAKLAETAETNISGEDESKWETALFSEPKPTVTDDTTYWIAILCQAGSGLIHSMCTAPDGVTTIYNTKLYSAGWIDPWEDESTYGDRSIYCSYTPGIEHTHSASDTLAISDSLDALKILHHSASDTLAIGDSMAPVMTFKQALSDTLNMSDALAVAATYNISLADAMAITDALVAAATYNVALADTLEISDSLAYAIAVEEIRRRVGLVRKIGMPTAQNVGMGM